MRRWRARRVVWATISVENSNVGGPVVLVGNVTGNVAGRVVGASGEVGL